MFIRGVLSGGFLAGCTVLIHERWRALHLPIYKHWSNDVVLYGTPALAFFASDEHVYSFKQRTRAQGILQRRNEGKIARKFVQDCLVRHSCRSTILGCARIGICYYLYTHIRSQYDTLHGNINHCNYVQAKIRHDNKESIIIYTVVDQLWKNFLYCFLPISLIGIVLGRNNIILQLRMFDMLRKALWH